MLRQWHGSGKYRYQESYLTADTNLYCDCFYFIFGGYGNYDGFYYGSNLIPVKYRNGNYL